jgi:hypothetical protein
VRADSTRDHSSRAKVPGRAARRGTFRYWPRPDPATPLLPSQPSHRSALGKWILGAQENRPFKSILFPAYLEAMTLFDDIDRTDRSPRRDDEDSFSFYNRAAGVHWQRIREVLEEWFAAYPDEHKADLRGHFRSKIAGQHVGAIWELYLHRLFSCMGYVVSVHPKVPGSTGRPDFELVREGERLYVEAAVVFSGVVDAGRDEIREGWIMEAVNKASHPNCYVLIRQFVQLGVRKPRDRAIYGRLTAWLDTLDPDQVTRDYNDTGRLPEFLVEVDDWAILFEAVPVKPEARGNTGRLLGGGPATAGYVDDVEQLRDTLKHKRGKYGTPDVPLVVAVNGVSSFMQPNDISGALYGTMAVQYRQGAPGSSKWVRQRDGTWMGEGGPRGRRMSAVLTAVQLHPSTMAQSQLAVWLNPWADVPLDVEWPFTVVVSTEEGSVGMEERLVDMAALLGLPEGWPGPEDPFA